MTDSSSLKEQRNASDYHDLDLESLQRVIDYMTKQTVPVGMTAIQIQEVLSVYTDFINVSLYNLNLLRALNGDPDFKPVVEGSEEDKLDVEPRDWDERGKS